MGWTRAINAQVYAENPPDPPHWTLNSCFGAFCSVWVHFVVFGCILDCFVTARNWMQSGLKMVELMHKFVAWNRIGSFRNECTRYTQSDPKLLFLCVSYCLGAFGNLSLLHETLCKIGWTGSINAQVRAMQSPWNFSQWTHPIQQSGP